MDERLMADIRKAVLAMAQVSQGLRRKRRHISKMALDLWANILFDHYRKLGKAVDLWAGGEDGESRRSVKPSPCGASEFESHPAHHSWIDRVARGEGCA